MSLQAIDWRGLLVPTVHPLELVLRGTIVYLLILAALRIFRREAGALSTADLLVIVLVADAAQNAMAANYHSVPEGLILIGTIFGWNYLLDWLGYRSRWVRRLLHPAPLLLVKEGRVNRRNMRAELLTMEDLMEQLREHGVESVSDVKLCYLEADGHLSVLAAAVLGTAGCRNESPVAREAPRPAVLPASGETATIVGCRQSDSSRSHPALRRSTQTGLGRRAPYMREVQHAPGRTGPRTA